MGIRLTVILLIQIAWISCAAAASRTWYVDPARGADQNSGLAPDLAWRSAAKVNLEARAGGAMSPWDTLVIDTRRAPLALGRESLTFALDGINVRPAAGQRYAVIKAEKTIRPGAWSKTAGREHLYETADTDPDIVLWQNDRWLSHPTGSTFAEVAARLEAKAGSFWTDGTKLYVHPLNHTDPTRHGTFTRSQFRPHGDSAVLIYGDHWTVTGLRVRKTCLARKTDNDPYVAYCFQQQGGSVSGTCIVRDCYFDYGSKHLLGFTANSTGSTVIAENVMCEQATPYPGFGGQSAFVSYMAAGSGNTHIYRQCRTIRNAGRIGSTRGEATTAYPVFLTHGQENAYRSLQIRGCIWRCGPFVDYGTVEAGGLIIKRSRLGETVLSSPDAAVAKSRLGDWCQISRGATITDSLLTSTINYQSRSSATLAGRVVIARCTLDLRHNPTPDGSILSPWNRAGALDLTFRRNAFLVDPTSSLTLISGLLPSDALQFSRNRYWLGPDGWLIGSYHGRSRTFSDWQSLGFDHASARVR